MNRRKILNLSAMTLLGLTLVPGAAGAQSIKDQIVGAWTIVSALDIHPDGRKDSRWGSEPKGIFIFDKSGHFAFFLTRSDLPKIAAGRSDQGTEDEYKAIMKGLGANFGTYTVNEADKTIVTKVAGGSYPNLIGREQKRIIMTLNADELKYTNAATTTGVRAESLWKRIR
jgi:hypothetical protein